MHFHALLMLAAAPSIFATLTTTLKSSTSETIQCKTQLTTNKPKTAAPTSTVTKTLPTEVIIIVTTSAPSSTITPTPVTSTQTITSQTVVTTTNTAVTATFSTTSTASVTNTITASSIVTIFSTDFSITTSTTTSVAPTSSGFVAIDDSTGYTNYVGASKDKRVEGKADMKHPHDVVLERRKATSSSPASSYPAAVTCTDYKQVIYTEEIIFFKPASTVTGSAPTSTVSTTVTATSTSTVVPSGVSKTLSFSTTTTLSTTTTVTGTTFVPTSATITATSTTTSYAACATNNILGPQVQGPGIPAGAAVYDISQSGSTQSISNSFNFGNVTSAYDCCALCQGNAAGPNCLYSEFQVDESNCIVFIGDTCPVGTQIGTLDTATGPPGSYLIVSDGNCGSVGPGYYQPFR